MGASDDAPTTLLRPAGPRVAGPEDASDEEILVCPEAGVVDAERDVEVEITPIPAHAVREWARVLLTPLVPLPPFRLPDAYRLRELLARVLPSGAEVHPWSSACHCAHPLVRHAAVIRVPVDVDGALEDVSFVCRCEPHDAEADAAGDSAGGPALSATAAADLTSWGHVSAATLVAAAPTWPGAWRLAPPPVWPSPQLAEPQPAPSYRPGAWGVEAARCAALVRAGLRADAAALAAWPPGLARPTAILLSGPAGVGKSTLVREIAARARAQLLELSAYDVFGDGLPQRPAAEERLRSAFAMARACAPCVLVLDHVDALVPASAGLEEADEHTAVLARLLSELDALADDSAASDGGSDGVVVIGTTCRAPRVHALARSAAAFADLVALEHPPPEARAELLRACIADAGCELAEPADRSELEPLARQLHGYVAADMAALVQAAADVAAREEGDGEAGAARARVLSVARLDAAARERTPSALLDLDGARPPMPTVRWSDVGGLDAAKAALAEMVIWPQTHEQLLDELGVEMAHGALLYGPPGTGKTLLAQAMASESRLNFLSVSIPDLVKGDVGGSEQAVARVFARARELAPSLVLLDELQAMFGRRHGAALPGGADPHAPPERTSPAGRTDPSASKMLAQLLLEMDTCRAGWAHARVVVVGTTNMPDALDPSLLQPGRFEHVLLVPPPDERGREAILRGLLARTPLAPLPPAEHAHGADDDRAGALAGWLAARTEGLTGADLTSLVRQAVHLGIEARARSLERAHLERALATHRPSVDAAMMRDLERWAAQQ